MIDARIINIEEEKYRLVGIIKDYAYSELIKTLQFIKDNEIPVEVNINDIADTDGEEYYIDSICLVSPNVGGEIQPYIAVYVR